MRISRNVSDYYTAELLNWRIFGWRCQEASSLPSLVHASCIGTMRCCQILTHIWHCNCITNSKSGWSEYHVLSLIQLHLILMILWDVFNLIFTEEKNRAQEDKSVSNGVLLYRKSECYLSFWFQMFKTLGTKHRYPWRQEFFCTWRRLIVWVKTQHRKNSFCH